MRWLRKFNHFSKSFARVDEMKEPLLGNWYALLITCDEKARTRF